MSEAPTLIRHPLTPPSHQDPCLLGAMSVIHVLRREGYTAYLAGGWVRDALLGRAAKDIDIATNARPNDVCRLFPDHVAIGAAFGVILVHVDGYPYEVATFRDDGLYYDGRHPDNVRFSTPAGDAARRDFTVNGLFYDQEHKEILDFVGGLADLSAKRIRAIGNPASRFAEDHLRILRTLRFAANLDFTIDPLTWDAVCQLAPSVQTVSAERIREEILALLTRHGADRGLSLLSECGLLDILLPEVSAMKGVAQPPEFHPEGDVFAHTVLMFSLADYPLAPALAMAILLHDVGKPATQRMGKDRIRFDGHDVEGARQSVAILRRLRFSHRHIEMVEALVRHHLEFMNVQKMRLSTLKRFLRMDNFPAHLELHRLDCLGSHQKLDLYTWMKAQYEELLSEVQPPPPLLRGKDLIALGLQPGPSFRTILTEIEDLHLENTLTTSQDAIHYIRSHFDLTTGTRL